LSAEAPGSVTRWIDGLKVGENEAAQKLWDRYFSSLVRLARKRLRQVPRGESDEEDVALVAFYRLCEGAVQGRFPRLNDRDDLWRVLATITTHGALDKRRYHGQAKRAGVQVKLGLHSADGESPEDEDGLGFVEGREPSPEFAAMMAEQCERLLALLDKEGLRQVALWKLEGKTREEIADRLDRGLSTVDRKLELIRKIWLADGAG
jgi:DNA-directed RNA polymerase specialized sigma24 family protein